ncbi:DUF4268 domain-containing protein [Rhizosphaericola mali]|uniref:DUF4268 domain-containing protein n=1 Tax=Rhizosphaericola mali TaxID=2545455 RepID=A0A5P2G4U9_9BACT|nr:DUF4268 domain-containing protein [Rhizosphaericola mali]QES89718.1 DUF4268 domain-containing protein [Rhizosphaericola mali]
MYSKEENFQFKKDFWTALGQYLKPIPNSEGEEINWINYKTGIRQLNFRMDLDRKNAQIAIEITRNDNSERLAIYEKFESLKTIFNETMQEDWIWQESFSNEHKKIISIIYKKLPDVSINVKENWPTVITFFKERIIKLDEFWNDTKVAFDQFKL